MFNRFVSAQLCAAAGFLFLVGGCQQVKQKMGMSPTFPTMGSIERLDPELDKVLAPGAKLEKLAGEFNWSEGPTWMKSNRTLYFSDVPMNIIYSWNEKDRLSVFSYKSGYSNQDAAPRGTELGTNGLAIDPQGRLVACDHGDRRVYRWNADGTKTTIVDKFEGKRFNSPNDLVYDSKGNLFFTDPPYGLESSAPAGQPDNHMKGKELDFQGVYRLSTDGKLTVLTKELTRPNGINLSPDEKTLYVAVSDSDKPLWMAYDLKEDGTIANGRVFMDATAARKLDKVGLPDGMKVAADGTIFATGPSGVWIMSPSGKLLGKIKTGQATGNCAWGDDGSTLYVMCDMYLCRIQTKVKGRGW